MRPVEQHWDLVRYDADDSAPQVRLDVLGERFFKPLLRLSVCCAKHNLPKPCCKALSDVSELVSSRCGDSSNLDGDPEIISLKRHIDAAKAVEHRLLNSRLKASLFSIALDEGLEVLVLLPAAPRSTGGLR